MATVAAMEFLQFSVKWYQTGTASVLVPLRYIRPVFYAFSS